MANVAAKNRALEGTHTFEFNEVEYTVDGKALDNVEVFELFEEDKYLTAVKVILGKEQFDKFKDANRVDGRVSMDVFGEFVEKMFEEFHLGN